jgi:hypothetical protein
MTTLPVKGEQGGNYSTEQVTIEIRTLTGLVYHFYVVPSSCQPENVKQMLFENKGIPICEQRLLVGGSTHMIDGSGKSLADYGISAKDNRILLVLPLRGGARTTEEKDR